MARENEPDLTVIRNIGVSMEEAARNFEANLPALREALGLRTMQEFGDAMQRFVKDRPPGRIIAAAVNEYNQRMAEINREGRNGAQDQ